MARRILTAREQHAMLAPWHQAAQDYDQWERDYMQRLRQEREDRQQNATKIYRGLRFDAPEELESFIKEHYRKDVPHNESEIGGHLVVGPRVLDHLQSAHPNLLNYGNGYGFDGDDKLGLGRHWTTNRNFAEKAAMQGGKGRHGVIIEADRPGPEYRDPNHTGVGGYRGNGHTPWREEEEDTLLPGTPLNVTSLTLNGKEVLHDPSLEKRMQRDWPDLPYPGGPRQHTAAVNQDLINRLHDEFHDWYGQGEGDKVDGEGSADDDFITRQIQKMIDAGADIQMPETPKTTIKDANPLESWPTIEQFMKAKYPAAHRGLSMGMEEAQPLLDGKGLFGDPVPDENPYETGPEAVAAYGYDPKEIAAGMLLLHNQNHGERAKWSQSDVDRLNDIAQKRTRMQRDYEQRQRQAATFLRMAGFDPQEVTRQIGDEFRDWAGQNQHRLHKTAPYGPERDWRNIENFLGDRYPAAHRGFSLGQEEAADRLDRPRKGRGYRTGPEAVERYGYDPKEIAAGALLLHNQSHPFRMDQSADLDRLTRIYDQRQQMQRDYERHLTTAATVDGDYAHIPRDENGRLLLTHNPGQAANWGGRVYEVQPEVEGPWAWNLSPFHDDPGFFNEGYVSPRAKVVREFGPEDFKEHYRKLEEEMYDDMRNDMRTASSNARRREDDFTPGGEPW